MQLLSLFVFLLFMCPLSAQQLYATSGPGSVANDEMPAYRKWVVGAGAPLLMAGTLVVHARSNGYQTGSGFHVNQTGMDWLHLDKFLHSNLAYTSARLLDGSLRWAGMAPRKAAWLSAGGSLAFLLAKEYLDGRDPRFGWSWGDVGANLAGTGLFTAQQLGWQEQRVQLKFSAAPKTYDNPGLEAEAVRNFGNSYPKRLIKNYNQHTYWLSANLKSLGQLDRFPAWLNISVGTGAANLFGKKENYVTGPGGTVLFDRRDLVRHRQWYLAPDVDLTKIKTSSKFLRTTLFVLNAFKFPAPALELSRGKLKVHALMW